MASSAVSSGGAGGARAFPEFGGSEKGKSLISAYWSLAITTNTPGFKKLNTALILDQIEIICIKLDQIGKKWIKLDQIGNDWIKLDQIGSNWTKLEIIESNLIKLDQT